MLAVHLDNFLFFVFVAIAMLFKWLSSAANKATKDSADEPDEKWTAPTPVSPRRQLAPNSDAERVRKFLEALGQPTVSTPPPPVAPRTDIPPRPLAPVTPPRTFFPKQRRPTPPKIRLPEPATATPYQPERSEEPTFEVQGRGPSPEPPNAPAAPVEAYATTEAKPQITSTDSSFVQLLRSRSGLRNAVILREIFGPPRSLQPMDVIGNA